MRYGPIVLSVNLAVGVSGHQASDTLRQTFLQRVDDYVALHRQLEGPLPPEVVTADVEALFAPRTALAAAIRTARAKARQGDIFAPAIAAYFRTVVADALREEASRTCWRS